MTDTDMLYMAALEKRLETAETENAELKALLRESQRLLRAAVFVNFREEADADKLYDKITNLIGREY